MKNEEALPPVPRITVEETAKLPEAETPEQKKLP